MTKRPRFQHARDFRNSLLLESARQMVHHQATQDDIEHMVSKGQVFDGLDKELNRATLTCGLGTRNGNHLRRRIDTDHPTRCANIRSGGKRHRARAAPDSSTDSPATSVAGATLACRKARVAEGDEVGEGVVPLCRANHPPIGGGCHHG